MNKLLVENSMTAPSDQVQRHRKKIQQSLTVILWLASVVLGLLAIPALIRGVDAQVLAYIFQRIQNQEMGPMTASTLSRATNLATILITGVLWIGAVIIAGLGYHSKRVEQRSSYRVFAWTIGIELTLILIGTLLQAA
jgi:hypothetical protein